MCQAVNRILQQRDGAKDAPATATASPTPSAVIVGMDGWHYPRATLETFPDPQLAKDRRGAAFTFDAKAFADFVESLRGASADGSLQGGTVHAPSFDHALKDPVAGDIAVLPSHRLVILEGLYCNCDDGEWARGARALDERWVVEVDRNVARERLRVRHVLTGVAKDEEEALWRADNNDLPNGDYLLAHTLEPARRIRSVQDQAWA